MLACGGPCGIGPASSLRGVDVCCSRVVRGKQRSRRTPPVRPRPPARVTPEQPRADGDRATSRAEIASSVQRDMRRSSPVRDRPRGAPVLRSVGRRDVRSSAGGRSGRARARGSSSSAATLEHALDRRARRRRPRRSRARRRRTRASAAAGPETTNAPGPSPNSSASDARPETVAPRPEARRALGQRDRDAALGDVVRGAAARRTRTAWRIAACSALSSPRSTAGSGPATGSPRSLDSSEAASDGAQPAVTSAIASPARDEPEPPGARARPAARRRGRRPASGRSGPRRPRCRARRCRRRPGCRTRGRRRRGPAIARVSCQAMCGFSGLPKFRQLVSPSGSAPTQARLAEHSSDGLDRAAVRVGGDAAAVAVDRHRDRGPGAVARRRRVERRRRSALDGASGSSSTAASACSGRRTVREPTIESYCSNAHWREARLAEPSSAEQRSRPGPSTISATGGAGYSGVAGSAGARS